MGQSGRRTQCLARGGQISGIERRRSRTAAVCGPLSMRARVTMAKCWPYCRFQETRCLHFRSPVAALVEALENGLEPDR